IVPLGAPSGPRRWIVPLGRAPYLLNVLEPSRRFCEAKRQRRPRYGILTRYFNEPPCGAVPQGHREFPRTLRHAHMGSQAVYRNSSAVGTVSFEHRKQFALGCSYIVKDRGFHSSLYVVLP